MKLGIALVLMAAVADAAPRPINIKVQNGQLFDIARQLSDQSGCRVTAWGTAKLDLDVTNATLWDALARLEVDHQIKTGFRTGGQIILEPKGSPTANSFAAIDPQPSWTKHWRGALEWAVALLGDRAKARARLVLLGLSNGTIDKVVIDKATSGGKALKVAPGLPVSLSACEPGTVILDLDSDVKKLSLRGHVLVKVPKVIEKRVVVPLDDSVVDLAEGRLRIHVASMPPSNGRREVMINWDGMGTAVRVTTELVDDTGAPVKTSGRGSGFSSSGQAHESYSVPASAKVTAILRIPSSATSDEKIPFKFDNETLDPPVGRP